ncbi:pyridoxal phosphate-dependent aminotransferase [Gudongella sp. SC589]|uniref:pyridoxal phosphate-dependent aminotransferase n=1 Tax=Gudongella sp. SC589 TaxID=3385990 RepID=UPI003904C342
MEHGGDIYTYGERFKGEILDYSSNINPLGPPEGLMDHLLKGYDELLRYPDIQYRRLGREVSAYLGCGMENTIVGNGAVEIIDNFIMDSHRVVLMEPCFSEYELRAQAHNKELLLIQSKKDYSLDLDSFMGKLRRGDLVILGNPNNPTGKRIEKEELIRLHEEVVHSGAYLLLDEAFFEFSPEDYDSVELFREWGYESVGIIRAATKFFSLPGIRLGYCCAGAIKAKKIRGLQLPWSVNSMADRAGLHIFKDKEYISMTKEYVNLRREELLDGIKKIPGIHPYPSQSNYILLRLEKVNEDYIFQKLINEGIMVRKCSSFKVLSDNHIRIAVKDLKSNQMLLEKLSRIMANNSRE